MLGRVLFSTVGFGDVFWVSILILFNIIICMKIWKVYLSVFGGDLKLIRRVVILKNIIKM